MAGLPVVAGLPTEPHATTEGLPSREEEYRVQRSIERNKLICTAVIVIVGLAGGVWAAEPETPAQRNGPWPLADTVGPKVQILGYDHGEVSPWIEFFTFDSPAHPKIVQLRREYRLEELVRGAKTDLEKAVRLKHWVAGALKFGTPAPRCFATGAAVALLARAKRGEVVWCGQAAMVFQQACLAVGLYARFIELGKPENPAGHFTTEVFLRERTNGRCWTPRPCANTTCNLEACVFTWFDGCFRITDTRSDTFTQEPQRRHRQDQDTQGHERSFRSGGTRAGGGAASAAAGRSTSVRSPTIRLAS